MLKPLPGRGPTEEGSFFYPDHLRLIMIPMYRIFGKTNLTTDIKYLLPCYPIEVDCRLAWCLA